MRVIKQENSASLSDTNRLSHYELLDYAINVLGRVKDPKGGR